MVAGGGGAAHAAAHAAAQRRMARLNPHNLASMCVPNVLTWNARSLHGTDPRQRIARLASCVRAHAVDVVMLQETWMSASHELAWQALFAECTAMEWEFRWSHGVSDHGRRSAGVAVFVSREWLRRSLAHVCSTVVGGGRWVCVRVDNACGERVNLISLYASASSQRDRASLFEYLTDFMRSSNHLPLCVAADGRELIDEWIVAGDFNMVAASFDSNSDTIRSSAAELVAYRDFLAVIDLEDVALTCALRRGFGEAGSLQQQLAHTHRPEFTHRTIRAASNSQPAVVSLRRLDRIYMSNMLVCGVMDVRVEPADPRPPSTQLSVPAGNYSRSDHDLVVSVAQVNFHDHARVHVYRFNTSLLSQPDFVADALCAFKDCCARLRLGQLPVADRFVHLVQYMREHARRFAKQCAANRGREWRAPQLWARWQSAMRVVSAAAGGATLVQRQAVIDALARYEAHQRQSAQAAAVLARRVDLFEQGELPAEYFDQVRTASERDNTPSGWCDANGVLRTALPDMLNVAGKFFSAQYEARQCDPVACAEMLRFTTSLASGAVRAGWEASPTLEELTEALDAMSTGKVPGSDGLPAEFFREFWPAIGPLYKEMVDDVWLHDGQLPRNFAVGRLILFFFFI